MVQIGNEGAAFKSQLGYISVLVVRDVMCPAVMKDADPFISQGADGSPPALSVGSLESVERSCPKRELDAVFRIFHKGLVEEERASDAALGAGAFAAAFDDRSNPAEAGQINGVGQVFLVRAESRY